MMGFFLPSWVLVVQCPKNAIKRFDWATKYSKYLVVVVNFLVTSHSLSYGMSIPVPASSG